MAIGAKGTDLSLSSAAMLPPEMAVRLLSESDVIARRMTRHIVGMGGLTDASFRSHRYLRTLTAACRDAFRTLIRLLNDGRGLRPGDLDRLGSMGAQQAELGVPLEVVFGAYRVAARVVWQEVVGQPALLNQVPPATVVAVTGRVLEYLDEISAAVGSAYLGTRERLMRQRDRDRDRVLQRLLAGDASEDLRRNAAAVDLSIQPPYTVVVCATGDTATEERLDARWRAAGALWVNDAPGMWTALLPLDVDAAALVERVDGDATFVVGAEAATLDGIADAARRARRALDVGRALEPERRVHHEADLAVFASLASDTDAMRRFTQRTLGTVLAQRGTRRDELVRTLDALVSTSTVGDAAGQLGLHRHTVVYRMNQLRELGIDVDTSAARHHVWLALRCLRLMDAAA